MLTKENILTTSFAVLALFCFCTTSLALPQGFSITEIAGPAGDNTFPYYDWAALNENGELCFRGASVNSSAILKFNGGSRTVIASSTDATGKFDAFTSGICSINDGGDVAFDACRNCQAIISGATLFATAAATSQDPIEYGVYWRSNSNVLVVVQESSADSAGFKQVSLPTINNASIVSFSGELNSGVQGIWLKDLGSLSNIFNSSGIFSELGGAFLNNLGQLTFGAKEDGDDQSTGIYGPSGNRIIGAFNGYEDTSLPAINNNGDIATLASRAPNLLGTTPENGVFVNGAPFILNTGDFEKVEINSFQAVSINDLGDVLFPAIKPNGNRAVFLAAAGRLLVLLEQGEFLPGYASPINFLSVGREALNNQRQAALTVVLQDGTELVLRLDPDNLIFSDDLCPQDNTKADPGVCGCGVSDADSNSDGILNCQVTSLVDSYARELLGLVRKFKKVSSSASKAKKKAAAKTVKDGKKALSKLFNLVKGSQSQVQLNSNKTKVITLANTIKRNVNLAAKITDSGFAKNKKTAISSINKLLKLLKLS